MRNYTFYLIWAVILLCGTTQCFHAQNCRQLMTQLESIITGHTYANPNPERIIQVTFYQKQENQNILYYAVVLFNKTQKRMKEKYLYQVDASTESEYAKMYLMNNSKAFDQLIATFNDRLSCGTYGYQ